MAAFSDYSQHDNDDEGDDAPTPSSSGGSGPLTELPDLPTQNMITLEAYRSVRHERNLIRDRHEQCAQALRQDADDVQRALYEQAERMARLYEHWVILHATMAPTFDQIAAMRALGAQIAQAGTFMGQLRRRYELDLARAADHELALQTLRAGASPSPWGGDAS